MSFRMCVFIEAISDLAKSGKKAGAARQHAVTGEEAHGKLTPARPAPRKPVVLREEAGGKIAPPKADRARR
jgi:hypothetical protein